MKKQDENRIEQLLQKSLPPIDPASEPSRDLWPAVLRRLDAESDRSVTAPGLLRHNWFDWALLAGLVLFALSFPATIPVFLYYL